MIGNRPLPAMRPIRCPLADCTPSPTCFPTTLLLIAFLLLADRPADAPLGAFHEIGDLHDVLAFLERGARQLDGLPHPVSGAKEQFVRLFEGRNALGRKAVPAERSEERRVGKEC